MQNQDSTEQTAPKKKLFRNQSNRVVILVVVVVAVIFGLGVGSFIYFTFVPQRNVATLAPSNFQIPSQGFAETNMKIRRFRDINKRKLAVAEQINGWTQRQRDLRGQGMYVDTASCTYTAATQMGDCVNPAYQSASYFSNRSFAPVLWGMFKYYQNTKDEATLAQIERDLQIVNEVVLQQPELYFIQNNDYNCFYLKDLYYAEDLSQDGKQIIYNICDQATYELVDLTAVAAGDVATEGGIVAMGVEGDFGAMIDAKVAALVSGTVYESSLDATWDQVISSEGLGSEDNYLGLFNDYRLLPELIVVAQMNPDNPHNAEITPLMDMLLSEYNYLGGLETRDSYLDSSMIIALAYYSQYIDQGRNPQIMELARKIYNEHYVPEEADTVDALVNYALVQYHLGYPMGPAQNALVAYFESDYNSFVNGQPEFVYDSYVENKDRRFTYQGNVPFNGLVSGVLSI